MTALEDSEREQPASGEGGCATPWRPDRTIVLIGMMGAGKTSVGTRLARRLGIPFTDTDAEIEAAANATVAEIFARDGEAVFRSGERRVIARLLGGPLKVLATGGGAFMDPGTRALIRARAVSVWLKADLDTLVRRTARRATRPLLLNGEPRAILEKLMAEREPVYAESDITVESTAGTADAMADRVLAALAAHGERSRR